jgi:DNA replication protein DnaC
MIEQTISKMQSLKLNRMAESYRNQVSNPHIQELSFDERIAILVDYETDERKSKKINKLITSGNFKIKSRLEDIDYNPRRNINKAQIATYSECLWVSNGHNIIITGLTGTGKSFLGCALGIRACYYDYKVQYYRLPRLLTDLTIAKSDGSYNKLMNKLKKVDLLVFDDFGLAKLSLQETRDFLELIEDRNTINSCMFISQIPVSNWYELFTDPTLADAIMDRLINNSYQIEIQGESMRSNISSKKH